MTKYIVVTPQFFPTPHKTENGFTVFWVQFKRSEYVVQADTDEAAIESAKRFGIRNPILENLGV